MAQDKELIELAIAMTKKSYVPYSHFHVGAAVETADGTIYTGCNVENASYPAGICAERNAIFHAVAEGHTKLVTIAIAGGSEEADGRVRITEYCSPCGVCRQVMREFANPKELRILLAKSVEDYKEYTLEELLPLSFGPESLQ